MQESIFPARKRLMVIGDIHGDLERLSALLRGVGVINERLQWTATPADTWLVQVGDQLDSRVRGEGSNSWEETADVQVLFFLRNLDREAQRHGGRVLSLLGNHEFLNVFGDFSYVSPKSLAMLGGPKFRAATFQPGQYMARILAERPVVVQIGSTVLCHAGLLPSHLEAKGSAADAGHVRLVHPFASINRLARLYLSGVPLNQEDAAAFQALFIDGEGIVWTRMALERAYATEMLPPLLGLLANVVGGVTAKRLVVGHNPMLDGITTSQTQNLWFVDTGMSRVFEGGAIQCLDIWDDGVPLDSNGHKPIRVIGLPPAPSVT